MGLAAFLLVLQLFAQRTWVIEVRGNDKVKSEDILAVMETLGVREGRNLGDLDIPALQLAALKELPDLAWCVVNLKGSVAYVEVTERIPTPELSNADEPSNIKAARDGRIVSIQTYTGQALVKEGDAVAGGCCWSAGWWKPTRGRCSAVRRPVFWRRRTAAGGQRPAEGDPASALRGGAAPAQPAAVHTGNPSVYRRPIEEQTALTSTKHMLRAGGIDLPVGIVNRRYAFIVPTEIVRTEEEAAALAAQRLAERVENELSAAEITDRRETGGMKDGCYVRTGVYTCIEEIGIEEQLLIGDGT